MSNYLDKKMLKNYFFHVILEGKQCQYYKEKKYEQY